jgi:hypothetical protein
VTLKPFKGCTITFIVTPVLLVYYVFRMGCRKRTLGIDSRSISTLLFEPCPVPFRLLAGDYRTPFYPPRFGRPGVGNPFGVVIDDTHISVGSEYAHYCAQRIIGLQPMDETNILEILTGFGGMAYYLLRDLSKTSYIGFDFPENIALTSYYLMKAFPQLNFALYGKQDILDALRRGKGTKCMVVVDGQGIPLGAQLVSAQISEHRFAEKHSRTGESTAHWPWTPALPPATRYCRSRL